MKVVKEETGRNLPMFYPLLSLMCLPFPCRQVIQNEGIPTIFVEACVEILSVNQSLQTYYFTKSFLLMCQVSVTRAIIQLMYAVDAAACFCAS